MKPFSRGTALLAIVSILLVQTFSSCTKKCDPDDKPKEPINVALTETEWDCFRVFSETYTEPAAGKFEFSSEGVKGFGETPRHGCFLITTGHWDVANRTIFMKWKGNSAGAFCGFVVSLVYNGGVTSYEDLNLTSTPTTYDGSVVVSDNVWYYTSVKFTNDDYVTRTATGDYAENGGTVIENRTGSVPDTKAHIAVRNGDPYAGSPSWVMVGELKIK